MRSDKMSEFLVKGISKEQLISLLKDTNAGITEVSEDDQVLIAPKKVLF